MAIKLSCPGCHSPFQLGDVLAGEKERCPRCGQPVPVPLTASPPAQRPPAGDAVQSTPPRPTLAAVGHRPVRRRPEQRPAASSALPWILAAAAGVLLWVAVGVMAWYFSWSARESAV